MHIRKASVKEAIIPKPISPKPAEKSIFQPLSHAEKIANSQEKSKTTQAKPISRYKMPAHGIFNTKIYETLPHRYWQPIRQRQDDYGNFLLGYKKLGNQGLRAILQNKNHFYQNFNPDTPLAAALFPTFKANHHAPNFSLSKQTQQDFRKNPLLRSAQRKVLDAALAAFGVRRFGKKIAVHRNILVDKPLWLRGNGGKDRLLLLQMITSLHLLSNTELAKNLAVKASELLSAAGLSTEADIFAKTVQIINEQSRSALTKPIETPPIKPTIEQAPIAPKVKPDDIKPKAIPVKPQPQITQSLEDKSANILIKGFRQIAANKIYLDMFSRGTDFCQDQNLRLKHEQIINGSPTEALKHLEKLSNRNINFLRQKTLRATPLNADEQRLYNEILQTKWHFRHQSNAHLADNNKLQLFSAKLLKNKGIMFYNATPEKSRLAVAYDDFIFWGLELSNDTSIMPTNILHDGKTYGKAAFIVPEEEFADKFTYFTLTDHASAQRSSLGGHFDDFQRELGLDFNEASLWLQNFFYRTKERIWAERKSSPMFSYEHMKEAVALAVIYFIRHFGTEPLRQLAFRAHTGDELDRLVDAIIQPEMHVPRIFSSNNFICKRLEEISIEELTDINNMTEIIEQAGSNRYLALRALCRAAMKDNQQALKDLIKHFHFTADDVAFAKKNTECGEDKWPSQFKMQWGLMQYCPDYKQFLEEFAKSFNEKTLDEMKVLVRKRWNYTHEDLMYFEKITRKVQHEYKG